MSLRKAVSSAVFCCARAPTNVSNAPVIASATYSSQRHRSAFLCTGLPIGAVIPYLLAYAIVISSVLQAFLFTSPGWDRLLFGPLLPLSPPQFTGKSPFLAESSMHTFRRNPTLALGQGNRPSGGNHGGTTNIPSKLEIDHGCHPPRARIPYSFRESGRGHRANYQCRRHVAGAGPGNAAGAGPGNIACPARLRF